jgi:hypothetical protein
MIAFSLKLSAFIIFLVSSFIACGYLISPCTAIFIMVPLPLPSCSVDFWRALLLGDGARKDDAGV